MVRIVAAIFLPALISGCVSQRSLEVAAHQEFTRMRQEGQISKDPRVQRYVRCVVDSIVDDMDEPWRSMHWDVEVFVSPGVNAFAMPGGKIGVFTGLLGVAENQDQLATVIGHEIAHVTEEHAADTANRSIATEVAAVAADAAWGAGSGTLVRAGADVGILRPFSRSQESEADLEGLTYMARAGFDPLASIQLWKNMEAGGGAQPPEFLSTHPSPDNRSAELIASMSEALVLYNDAKAAGKRPRCGP